MHVGGGGGLNPIGVSGGEMNRQADGVFRLMLLHKNQATVRLLFVDFMPTGPVCGCSLVASVSLCVGALDPCPHSAKRNGGPCMKSRRIPFGPLPATQHGPSPHTRKPGMRPRHQKSRGHVHRGQSWGGVFALKPIASARAKTIITEPIGFLNRQARVVAKNGSCRESFAVSALNPWIRDTLTPSTTLHGAATSTRCEPW